mgnify:CR=1 FL=1
MNTHNLRHAAIAAALATPHDDAPYTLDLRRLPIDRPMPEPEEETSP